MIVDMANVASAIADELERRNGVRGQRLLRRPEVQRLTGLSKSGVYALEKQGKFPRRVPLTKQVSGWVESEVQEWIEQRIAERGEAA